MYMISVSTPRKSAAVNRSQIPDIRHQSVDGQDHADADVANKQEATYQDMYSVTKKPVPESEVEGSSDDDDSSSSDEDTGTSTKANVSINAFRPIQRFNGHKHGILSVATTSQGVIASGSADRTASIWPVGPSRLQR